MIQDRLTLVERVNELGSLSAETFDQQKHVALAQELVHTLDSQIRLSYVLSASTPGELQRKYIGRFQERIGEYKITKFHTLPFLPLTEMIFEHYQTEINESVHEVEIPRIAIVYNRKNMQIYGIMVQENKKYHVVPFLLVYNSRGARNKFLWVRNSWMRFLYR